MDLPRARDRVTHKTPIFIDLDGTLIRTDVFAEQLLRLLNHLQNDAPVLIVNSLSLSADRALQSGHLDLMEFHIEASGNPALARPR